MGERQSELTTEMCNSWLLASCGNLPGADIVAAGLDALADLASGERREFTVEALLVAVGARQPARSRVASARCARLAGDPGTGPLRGHLHHSPTRRALPLQTPSSAA